jgi:hypothetical protein
VSARRGREQCGLALLCSGINSDAVPEKYRHRIHVAAIGSDHDGRRALVIGRLQVCIGTGSHQARNDAGIAVLRCEHERGSTKRVACIEVGAPSNQGVDAIWMAFRRRDHQGRPATCDRSTRIRSCGQLSAHLDGIATFCRFIQRQASAGARERKYRDGKCKVALDVT